MAVTSDHIWYPGGGATAYDLRKIVSWSDDNDDATKVRVRFIGDPIAVVTFVKADFETAKQDSIDAGG